MSDPDRPTPLADFEVSLRTTEYAHGERSGRAEAIGPEGEVTFQMPYDRLIGDVPDTVPGRGFGPVLRVVVYPVLHPTGPPMIGRRNAEEV